MENLQIKFSNDTSYLTHNYHPYPCKFVPQIPNFIINKFSKEGDWILDPFAGSGTTLVEASLLNRNSIGIDLNPVAVLSGKVKTSVLGNEDKDLVYSILGKLSLKDYSEYVKLINSNFDVSNIPKFKNINHWFLPYVIKEISALKTLIDEKYYNKKVHRFLLLALSNIIVPVSNQDSETRYVAIKKTIEKSQVFNLFRKKILEMLIRNDEYAKRRSNSKSIIYYGDSKKMNKIDNNSVNLVLTSPPYINTFDYYLYHKLRILWLGFDPSMVRKFEIGCHHTANDFKSAFERYKKDIGSVFSEFERILTNNGSICIIIGDGILHKRKINSFEIIRSLAKENNFRITGLMVQKLKNTTRSFNTSFSIDGKNEYIILLNKI